MASETKDNRLKEFLDNGRDWERKQTNVPGVFLIRLPQFRSRPALGLNLTYLTVGAVAIGEGE